MHDQREMHVLMQKEQQAISEFHKLLLSKQSKVQLKIFLVKMSFICIRLENSFHSNGFALSLTLKSRAMHGARKTRMSLYTLSDEWWCKQGSQDFSATVSLFLRPYYGLFYLLSTIDFMYIYI